MMARIIWHNGNFMAKVSQQEAHLCSIFLNNLIDQHIVSSVLTNNKYLVEENENGSKKCITVKKKKFLEKTVGRNPKFITNEVTTDGRSYVRS